MISVKTQCDECGPVSIDPGALQIHLEDDPTSFYSCACPSCGRVLGGTVGTPDAFKLCGHGATISPIGFSQELLEHPAAGRKFTTNDVIDFHDLLESKNWFLRLENSIRQNG